MDIIIIIIIIMSDVLFRAPRSLIMMMIRSSMIRNGCGLGGGNVCCTDKYGWCIWKKRTIRTTISSTMIRIIRSNSRMIVDMSSSLWLYRRIILV